MTSVLLHPRVAAARSVRTRAPHQPSLGERRPPAQRRLRPPHRRPTWMELGSWAPVLHSRTAESPAPPPPVRDALPAALRSAMGKVGAGGGYPARLSALFAGAGLLLLCASGACGSCCPHLHPSSGPRWAPTPGAFFHQGPRGKPPATPPPLLGRPLFAVAPGDRALPLERARGTGASVAVAPRSGRRKRSGADPEKAEQGEGSSRSPRGVLRDGGLQQPGTQERDPDKATRFRMEELKLTSTTFALTGDSAHNQAMVHWSGHNSSVSRMGLRAKGWKMWYGREFGEMGFLDWEGAAKSSLACYYPLPTQELMIPTY